VSRRRNAALPAALALAVLGLTAADPARAPRPAPGDKSGGGGTSRRATPARRFPDGAGRVIAERSCLACHSAMLTTQQRKDSLGWNKTVSQMESWSAPLPAETRDTLLLYLREHFGANAK
jgi:hypothetical protein